MTPYTHISDLAKEALHWDPPPAAGGKSVAASDVRQPAPAQAAEARLPPVKVNAFQKVGFVMLALYLVGSYFNDIGIHVLGVVPRLTLIPLALMWVSLAFSGNIGRALQAPMGRWWLAMFVTMTLSVPFSTWPGGSTSRLSPRIW